jgi:hypothetical protein
MSRDSQRSECAQVPSILERQKAERQNDKENCLLVDVPAKKKGCVAAEGDCCDKVVPGRTKKKLDE